MALTVSNLGQVAPPTFKQGLATAGTPGFPMAGLALIVDITLGATTDYGANGIDVSNAATGALGVTVNPPLGLNAVVDIVSAQVRTSGGTIRNVTGLFDATNKTLRFYKSDTAILSSSTTVTSSAAAGAETIVGLYAMPANTINANTQGFYITAWGTTTAQTTATRTYNVKLGATGTLGGTPTGGFSLTGGLVSASTSAAQPWVLAAQCLRTGSAAQIGSGELSTAGGVASPQAGQATGGTQDFTTALQVVVTAIGSTATSDVTLNGFWTQFIGTTGAGIFQEIVPSSDLGTGDIVRCVLIGI